MVAIPGWYSLYRLNIPVTVKLDCVAEDTPGLTADDRVSYEKSMNELDQVMAKLSEPKLERPSQISELIHRRRTRV